MEAITDNTRLGPQCEDFARLCGQLVDDDRYERTL